MCVFLVNAAVHGQKPIKFHIWFGIKHAFLQESEIAFDHLLAHLPEIIPAKFEMYVKTA